MRDVRGDRAGHARQISSNLLASSGVAIQHNHVRAFFQKAGRSRGTDAAGAAGDENSLAVKTSHEGVRIQFVVVEEKLAMVGAYKKAFNRKDRKGNREGRFSIFCGSCFSALSHRMVPIITIHGVY